MTPFFHKISKENAEWSGDAFKTTISGKVSVITYTNKADPNLADDMLRADLSDSKCL